MELSPFADSFVFGLASSLHCAGMCGPLGACFLAASADGRRTSAIATASVYQGTRLLGYALVGATLGGIGATVGRAATGSPVAATGGTVALALAMLLLLGAAGAHRLIRLPAVGAGGSALRKVWGWALGRPPAQRAAALGFVTPMLPCGVLWVMYATAAASGSAAGGALAAAGFALGSLPLLWLAQAQLMHLRRWFGPRAMGWLQVAAMVGAAGVLAWRGFGALAADTPVCCG